MTAPVLGELALMNLFLQTAPFHLPGIHVERRAIINERSARGHWLKNGEEGQSDVFVVYRGLHVELEMKASKGSMRKAQLRWRARCVNPPKGWHRIPHLILTARKGEPPADTVARWVAELRTAVEAA